MARSPDRAEWRETFGRGGGSVGRPCGNDASLRIVQNNGFPSATVDPDAVEFVVGGRQTVNHLTAAERVLGDFGQIAGHQIGQLRRIPAVFERVGLDGKVANQQAEFCKASVTSECFGPSEGIPPPITSSTVATKRPCQP